MHIRLRTVERALLPRPQALRLIRTYYGWPPQGDHYLHCPQHVGCSMQTVGTVELHCIPTPTPEQLAELPSERRGD